MAAAIRMAAEWRRTAPRRVSRAGAAAPEPLRDVIARHGLSASKALGQNFILDRHLLARIAAIPGPLAGASGLRGRPRPRRPDARAARGRREGGRGRARPPLPAGAGRASRRNIGDRLRLIEGDALKLDERAEVGEGAHVVANLPYNVGTALLLRWLEAEPWPPWWRSLTLMFQKEVAERIVAQPGSAGLRPPVGRGAVAERGRGSR